MPRAGPAGRWTAECRPGCRQHRPVLGAGRVQTQCPRSGSPRPRRGPGGGQGEAHPSTLPRGQLCRQRGPCRLWGTPGSLRMRENGSDSYHGLSQQLDAARCPHRTGRPGQHGDRVAWRGHRRQGIKAPWNLRGRPARRCQRRPGGQGLWHEDPHPFAQSGDPFAAAGRSGLKVPAGRGQRWKHGGWAVRPLVPAGMSGSSGQRGTQIPPPGAEPGSGSSRAGQGWPAGVTRPVWVLPLG